MDYSFAAHQIAEIAAEIEDEGAKFYSQLADLSDDDTAKGIFTILAKQELDHKASFSAIAQAARRENKEYEYAVNVYRIMSNSIWKLNRYTFDIRALPKTSFNVREALEIAIHTEEDAISIYTEIRKAFIERFHSVLDSIIDEENKHLQILKDLENKL